MTDGFQKPDWIEERPYQQEAIRAWIEPKPQGILNMATGTGKTVTALLAAAHVREALDNQLSLIIAVPYQHLVEQWAEDVRDFGGHPVLSYKSRRDWQERIGREILEFNLELRESLVVITTHRTFASKAFQREISKIRGAEQMLIADEVHHLGAPNLRQSLPETIPVRLGLSATPERFYDEEGTAKLFEYFGTGVEYRYPLKKAITEGNLCEYYYIPHVVELTTDEAEQYLSLSKKIAKLASRLEGDLGDADLQENENLKKLLFKRARLLGTAENKLERLTELIDSQKEIKYTLVYCGDGSVSSDATQATKRHVDATVELLQKDLGIRARRFTARETQEEREDLLNEFENGTLEVLVAIRCLDEGVDVPATETAFVLASSSNPRQFVQRRGRILRPHPGKDFAVIHDFIVVPPGGVLDDETSPEFASERSLIRKEIERVNFFSDAARNHPDAEIEGIPTGNRSIQSLKRKYNLLNL